MDASARLAAAAAQLDRILGFFPRVETKLSLVLGVDAALLGLLAANVPGARQLAWHMAFAVVPVLLIGESLRQVYLGSFPNLAGGQRSLIYFREVADRTEPAYLAEFGTLTDEALAQDLLSQTWRNACILREKFDHLKRAFQLTAWALLPWAVTLAMFAAARADARALFSR